MAQIYGWFESGNRLFEFSKIYAITIANVTDNKSRYKSNEAKFQNLTNLISHDRVYIILFMPHISWNTNSALMSKISDLPKMK